MLNSFFISNKFYKLFSIGLIFDFFLKKTIEVIVKNILIYLAQFFAEKFLIEIITKKSIELYIYILNKNNVFFFFSIFNFFFYLLIFLISVLF